MTTENRQWLSARTIFGLIVVGVGVVFLSDNLGWADARDWLRFWPLGLVAVGLAKLVQDHTSSGRVFGGLLVVVGSLTFIDTFYLHDLHPWRWWPLGIVAFGILILLKAFGIDDGSVVAKAEFRRASADFRPASDTPRAGTMASDMNEVAIWSGVNRRVSSPTFKRANLTAIMGGVEFDLRQAGTDGGEAVIEVFVIWGGIEIKVPPDWAVSNQITAIMGGAEDSSTGTQQARNRLIVKGIVIMGGVDIKT